MVAKQRAAEISDLLAQINMPALLKLASSLNNGSECIANPGSTSMMGCCNYHLHIIFPISGQKWLVRVPRPGYAKLHDVIDIEYQYASEFATLKFLENTAVPAPKAFAYGVASNAENDIGVTYLIMEFLEGKPFNPLSATVDERRIAYEGVAKMMIELSKWPLSKACSLVPPNSGEKHAEPVIGGIAGLRSKIVPPLGPFDTAEEFYSAIISEHLNLIANGKLYTEMAVEAYLAYAILQDHVSELLPLPLQGSSINAVFETQRAGREELFFLTHIDAKGDHILISPRGEISGIIDWQGARFAPFTEAFGPSLFTADLHSLYNLPTSSEEVFNGCETDSGINPNDHLLASLLKEYGESRMAETMTRNDKVRRFHFGLRSAKTQDEMWESVKGLLGSFGLYNGEILEEWRRKGLIRYKGDARLETILERGDQLAM